jgi:hypothetical protein
LRKYKLLPKVSNFIDIGEGEGTEDLWKKFKDKRIICIDPLREVNYINFKLLNIDCY